MDQFGVASIPCGIFPTEIFLHSKKRIQTLEDFKGVKLRTAGAWAEIAGGLGASTVILPGAEVYPALERGVIDATEWSSPSVNVPSGFHKIAKYVIMPGVHQPGATQECVFNLDAWNRISEGDRELLKLAGKLGVLDSWARYAYKDIAALKEFDKAGNELVLLDDEFVSTANEAANACGGGPGGGERVVQARPRPSDGVPDGHGELAEVPLQDRRPLDAARGRHLTTQNP